ncbi:glycosyltransferase family 2 protein [Roseovarius sp. SYSU LYC5161]|uniref:glycosyltransferase family 2 protein n=1 Tax=Roseovarius halophilus (ex Wu et al. 2025) TaxID=3376060 RepID=UPI00399AC9AF
MNADLTVVVPAFNAARTIASTLQSIADSSYIPHKVILVNDGSTDDTVREVTRFTTMLNLQLINQENQGISCALNNGMKLVKTQFVARLDADDLVHPQRFEKQVEFLLKNPKICVLGSSVKEFGNSYSERHYPMSEIAVLLRSTHSTIVAHPSVTARTLTMTKYKYNSSYNGIEDHELWCRMLAGAVRITNLPEVYTYYRVHRAQISAKPSRRLMALKTKVNKDFFNHEYVRSRLLAKPITESGNNEDVTELAVAIIKNEAVHDHFRFQIKDLLRDSRVPLKVKCRLGLALLGRYYDP